jgi:hypothetical protein
VHPIEIHECGCLKAVPKYTQQGLWANHGRVLQLIYTPAFPESEWSELPTETERFCAVVNFGNGKYCQGSGFGLMDRGCDKFISE